MQYANLDEQYRATFTKSIEKGVEVGQFDKELLTFDMKRLADALVIERDFDFKYFANDWSSPSYSRSSSRVSNMPSSWYIFARFAPRTAWSWSSKNFDRNTLRLSFNAFDFSKSAMASLSRL